MTQLLTFSTYVEIHVDTVRPQRHHQDQYYAVMPILHLVPDVFQLPRVAANIILHTEQDLQ